ncbi:MAG: cell envelope integrity protein CreD [Draconibacterium sp.]|nr:MAG: cell envelope integrity protein CreD [Draconibacterium sp.]
MQEQTSLQSEKTTKWIKTSITVRMITVGLLTLLFSIPLFFIKNLINERQLRQKEVVKEISQQWGNEVVLYGPILKIPYKSFEKKKIFNSKNNTSSVEMIESIDYVYALPEKLNIESTIDPQEKKRGIYKTAVYKSDIHISGKFENPDFSHFDINTANILWNKSKLIFKTSNLKGMNSITELKLNDTTYPLFSNYNTSVNRNSNNLPYQHNKQVVLHELESKFVKKSDLPLNNKKSFALDMKINGSEQIQFVPIGKETLVNVKSNWKTANFIGEFLPYNEDKITTTGFDAKWKVLALNRPFSQQFKDFLPNLQPYLFGVNFMIPVDEYQKSERSIKYGFLVIGLTFLIFFLIQTISKIPIHPFQYLMIGLALTMFYTLLISISEHSTFLKAYIIGSVAVIGLITFYTQAILKRRKFTILITSSLVALYVFIFVIIQLESFALLVGSIGLFLILAAVMFISRKIDWNNP